MSIKIHYSKQANTLLKQMPKIDKQELIDWFCNIKKISIGGGDIVDFLNYKNGVIND